MPAASVYPSPAQIGESLTHSIYSCMALRRMVYFWIPNSDMPRHRTDRIIVMTMLKLLTVRIFTFPAMVFTRSLRYTDTIITIQHPSRICIRKSSMWPARGASHLSRQAGLFLTGCVIMIFALSQMNSKDIGACLAAKCLAQWRQL